MSSGLACLASLLAQQHGTGVMPLPSGLMSQLFKGGFLPRGERDTLGVALRLGMVSSESVERSVGNAPVSRAALR